MLNVMANETAQAPEISRAQRFIEHAASKKQAEALKKLQDAEAKLADIDFDEIAKRGTAALDQYLEDRAAGKAKPSWKLLNHSEP